MIETDPEFKSFFGFLLDKNQGLLYRIGAFFILVFILVGVDNYIGFTYHYGVSHKIEGVEKIEVLLKSDSINGTVKNDLRLLEKELLRHDNFFYTILKSIKFTPSVNTKHQNAEATIGQPTRYEVIEAIKDDSTFILLILSTCGFSLLWGLYLSVRIFFSAAFSVFGFGISIGVFFVFFLLASVLLFTLVEIPLINNDITYNILLNFLLQALILFSLYFLYNMTTKNAMEFEKKKRRGEINPNAPGNTL